MSELGTGDYNFSILDKATSDILGKTNLVSNPNNMTLDHSTVESTGANSMGSGQYSLQITGVSGNNISYDLTKSGDASFGTNGTLSVTNANLTGTGASMPAGFSIDYVDFVNPPGAFPTGSIGTQSQAGVSPITDNSNLTPGEFSSGLYQLETDYDSISGLYSYQIRTANPGGTTIYDPYIQLFVPSGPVSFDPTLNNGLVDTGRGLILDLSGVVSDPNVTSSVFTLFEYSSSNGRRVTSVPSDNQLKLVSIMPTEGSGSAGDLGELPNGTYTVKLTQTDGISLDGIGGSNWLDDSLKIELLDSNNNPVMISDDPLSGNGSANSSVTFPPDDLQNILYAVGVYDTGRGLLIYYRKDDAVDSTPITASFTYTPDGAGNSSGAVGDLLDNSGNILGVNIGTDLSSLVVGQTVNFEYIAKNEAKVALENHDGQALQIAQNAGGTQNGLYRYAAAGGTYNSGRGVQMQLSAFNSLATGTGGIQDFSYERANAYSVDLSNATKAGAYMTTVTNALNTINSQLANLGSLMARLSFKAEQTANAQVNVEGAYSRIMNANMAEEQMNASKYGILQQTAIAMLSQANQAPRSLLSLFR